MSFAGDHSKNMDAGREFRLRNNTRFVRARSVAPVILAVEFLIDGEDFLIREETNALSSAVLEGIEELPTSLYPGDFVICLEHLATLADVTFAL